MRLFTILCTALVLSGLAAAQTGQNYAGRGYGYSYGPYVPLVTTPEISLQSYPVGPTVGATNATGDLAAGARNSTLSMHSGISSTVYTQPVWYSGGTTPLMSHPSVRISQGISQEEPGMMMQPSAMRMEHMEHQRAEGQRTWTYFGETELASAAEASGSAKNAKRAGRSYTNQDVENENQKNGTVKYGGKTEQIK
jgi:hypothetical protein